MSTGVSFWVAALAGVGISAAVNFTVVVIARRRSKISAAEQKFTEALTSDDLNTLAKYLRDELGGISVADYLKDTTIRRDVDKYLAKLSAFVARPSPDPSAEPDKESPQAISVGVDTAVEPEPPSLPATMSALDGDPPEIQRALQTLRDGDIWSALARLRRDLESLMLDLRKRGFGEALGLSPGHPSGRFSLTTDVPPEALPFFRRFYRVASAAVHGQTVSLEEALRAIGDARQVFAIVAERLPQYRE